MILGVVMEVKAIIRVVRLSEHLENRFMSAERLAIRRNMGYGGAAACFLIIMGIMQVGANDVALRMSTIAASVGLPFWLINGATYELFIFAGKQSDIFRRSKLAKDYIEVITHIAGVALAFAVCCIVFYLVEDETWFFVVACIVALILFYSFSIFLARWWFSEDGPGANKAEKEKN